MTEARRSWPTDQFQHPARVLVGGCTVAVGCGTGLLSLPIATDSGEPAELVDALFTATSAVCVTGLVTVDTGTHWSTFGQLVILALIQIGGLGIMTVAALVTVLVSGRLGLSGRLVAQVDTQAPGLQGIGRLIRNIAIFAGVSEALIVTVLTARLMAIHDWSFGQALYSGFFHGISAFNNAGFSLHSTSMSQYVDDPVIILTIALAVIVGGLGFPVLFELVRSWRRPRSWSVMTRLTVWVSGVLLLVGWMVITFFESTNPKTFGELDNSTKLLAGFFHSANCRSGGFNSVEIVEMRPESLFVTDVLMFIGGGSASTAGGIKVTTFGLLALMIWSEIRGEFRVNVGRRRVPETNQRQALAVALIGLGTVATATTVLLAMGQHALERVLFEAVSASAIVGLSAGITPELTNAAQLLLVVLMIIGRTGPLTIASALALRSRSRRYELPEERTIVG